MQLQAGLGGAGTGAAGVHFHDAIASSSSASQLVHWRGHEESSLKLPSKRLLVATHRENAVPRFRLRVSAALDVAGEEDADADTSLLKTSDNGVVMSSDDRVLSSSTENSVEHAGKRAPTSGLFRTPISGGVQSATSSHGLPQPALAVRNLMEQARFAHLCTIMSRMHHRRLGYPFGTLVDFAADTCGHPIFSLSPLEIHTRNLLADPRCTLVVQVPGFSGLGNARATLFGDVYPLPPEKQDWAHKHYMRKHQQGASQQWGNFYYYQMQRISDILFVGGFGTVAWVDVNEFENAQPDIIAANGDEETLKELNAIFSRPLREMLSAETETEVDDAAVISIDSKGIDIRVRQVSKFNVQRLPFDGGHPVETLDEAKAALDILLKKRTRRPSVS